MLVLCLACGSCKCLATCSNLLSPLSGGVKGSGSLTAERIAFQGLA